MPARERRAWADADWRRPMSRCSPFVVELSDAERCELERRARRHSLAHPDVVRARIVPLAAEAVANVDIAEELGVHVDVVSRWRKRFCQQGLAGLDDRARSRRPRRFGPEVVAAVKAMACEAPARQDVPLSRWSPSELAAQAVSEGLVSSVSPSTVRRWLAVDAIKPWQYESWIFPRDPGSAAKAARVLDLHARVWNGRKLGPNDYVISADEKSQLRAPSRCHRSLAGGPRRATGVEFEYQRHGTLAYFGAYDVHHGRLIGQVAPHHRDRPVRRAGGQGHDHRAVRVSPAGVLGRGQRLLPLRPRLRHRHDHDVAHRHTGAPTGARLLAQPDRDRVPSSNAKSSGQGTSPTLPPSPTDWSSSRPATAPPLDPSTGPSPELASSNSVDASTNAQHDMRDPGFGGPAVSARTGRPRLCSMPSKAR
jgi:transposase